MKLQYFTNLKTLAGDDSHHDSSHSEVTIIGHYNLTRFQGTRWDMILAGIFIDMCISILRFPFAVG